MPEVFREARRSINQVRARIGGKSWSKRGRSWQIMACIAYVPGGPLSGEGAGRGVRLARDLRKKAPVQIKQQH